MGHDQVSEILRLCIDKANKSLRDWRDPRWTSARAVAQGLDDNTRIQRRLLTGMNVIDIASKSIWSLLVDEVSYLTTCFAQAC